MVKIRTAWLDHDEDIEPVANHYLEAYRRANNDLAFPVEPELIFREGVEISPETGLLDAYGVRAALDRNLQTIYIDNDFLISEKTEHLVRGDVAHEIAHRIYHRDIVEWSGIHSVQDASRLHQIIDDKTYRNLEIQANMFAGALLVPRKEFIDDLVEALKEVQMLNGKLPGIAISELLARIMRGKFTRKYGVSETRLRWRIKDLKVYDMLGVLPSDMASAVSIHKLSRAHSEYSLPKYVVTCLDELQLPGMQYSKQIFSPQPIN